MTAHETALSTGPDDGPGTAVVEPGTAAGIEAGTTGTRPGTAGVEAGTAVVEPGAAGTEPGAAAASGSGTAEAEPPVDSASDEQPPPLPRRPLRHLAMAAAPVIGVALLFGLWELYVRAAGVHVLTLPPPSRVLRHLAAEPGFYWEHSLITIQEATLGFWLGFAAAMVVATFMAHSRFVERAILPNNVLLQSTPVVVLAPVFLIWFGFNIWPKALTAAVFCYVPFVVNAFTGLRAIDENALELMRSVSSSRWEIFRKLRLPHSLPYLFSSARLCLGLALVGAVIGEAAGSTGGLGHTAWVAQSRLLVDQLWGSIFTLAFIGVAANLVLIAVEARMLRWHSSQTTRN